LPDDIKTFMGAIAIRLAIWQFPISMGWNSSGWGALGAALGATFRVAFRAAFGAAFRAVFRAAFGVPFPAVFRAAFGAPFRVVFWAAFGAPFRAPAEALRLGLAMGFDLLWRPRLPPGA
jgi:hypothetical protein